MHLVYIDETGNTGKNLSDPQQPLFLLCALLVHKDKWQQLEDNLQSICTYFLEGNPKINDFEIHATEIRNGTGMFRGVSVSDRIALRDQLLQAAIEADTKLIYRAIEKQRFKKWMNEELGSGISVNPHVYAFALISQVINSYLQQQNTLGILISDENKEIITDVEKSIKVLRGESSSLRLDRIIEKGFFIDSRKSLVLQLCDLCAYSLRKKEEYELGIAPKSIDASGIQLVKHITHIGDESFHDVLEWIKKERPGNSPESFENGSSGR